MSSAMRRLIHALAIIAVLISSIFPNVISEDCHCRPTLMNFNETVIGEVASTCPRCYYYQYSVPNGKQDWIPRLCIQKDNTSDPNYHLYVIVKESFNVMSFQVPITLHNLSTYFEVCRTLCPITSYPDYKNEYNQNISIEISASRDGNPIAFSLTLSTVNDFVITENSTRTLNVRPAMAHVLQYDIEEDTRGVRIEAHSKEDTCMLLAVQAAQCPIYDTESPFELEGYFQTSTRVASIAIQKTTFPKGQQYIVVFLLPTDDKCFGKTDSEINPANRTKEVTISIVPSITDYDFALAVYLTLGFFLAFWIISWSFCCPVERRICDLLPTAERHCEPEDRKKHLIYIIDASKLAYTEVTERSRSYPRNLIAIAIFYAMPVVQLVFINQNIVNLIGDQDLCYYNFLCSHQAGMFIDFNHIYSNIGYVMLGFLFIFLVWRRSQLDEVYEESIIQFPKKGLGVPRNSGLLYAMGWALIMEGVLSASYHVCPCKTNFQFDTAFMFVMIILCMLKLYQSRHPDLTPQSHAIWVILAVINALGFWGAVEGGPIVWGTFVLVHIFLMIYVVPALYSKGRWKQSMLAALTSWKCVCDSFRHYLKSEREAPCVCYTALLFMILTIVGNLAFDIFVIVHIPSNFGGNVLNLLIANCGLYLAYYMIMKWLHDEARIFWPCDLKAKLAGVYFYLAIILWTFAYYFYSHNNAQWQVTPAMSRTINTPCYESLWNFYDSHDVWHLLSSIALYFTFMAIMTLDDDVETRPRTELLIF